MTPHYHYHHHTHPTVFQREMLPGVTSVVFVTKLWVSARGWLFDSQNEDTTFTVVSGADGNPVAVDQLQCRTWKGRELKDFLAAVIHRVCYLNLVWCIKLKKSFPALSW